MPRHLPHQWPVACRRGEPKRAENWLSPSCLNGFPPVAGRTRDCGKRTTSPDDGGSPRPFGSGMATPRLVELVSPDLVGEADAREAELLRRPALVPAMAAQDLVDQPLLHAFDPISKRRSLGAIALKWGRPARGGENGGRHQLGREIFAVLGQRDHAAD